MIIKPYIITIITHTTTTTTAAAYASVDTGQKLGDDRKTLKEYDK